MWKPLVPNTSVENWILNPIGKDMLTMENRIHGMSNNVVVCFQEDDEEKFELNIWMRAKAILVVVYIPKLAFDTVCFCGNPIKAQRCGICYKVIDQGNSTCPKLECIEKKPDHFKACKRAALCCYYLNKFEKIIEWAEKCK